MRSTALTITSIHLSVGCFIPAQNELRLEMIREIVIESGSDTLTYSPDGRWLASGGSRGDLKLIDTGSGEVARVIQVPGSANCELRFSSDSKRLAIVSCRSIPNERGATLGLYEVATGKLLHHREVYGHALDWSRDGQWIAIAESDTEVSVLRASDLSTVRRLRVRKTPTLGERLRDAFLRYRDSPHAVALTANGERLAVSLNQELRVFDTVNGRLVKASPVEGSSAAGLKYSNDGTLHRCSGRSGEYEVLGRARAILEESTKSVVRVQADGSRCALSHSRGTTVFHRDGSSFLVEQDGSVDLHPNGRTWALAGRGVIDEYDGSKRQRRIQVANHAAPGHSVITRDGRWVAVETSTREVLVFDVATGARVRMDLLDGARLIQDHSTDHLAMVGTSPSIEFWEAGNNSARQPARSLSISRGSAHGAMPRMSRNGAALAARNRWWRLTSGEFKLVGRQFDDLSVQFRAPSPNGEHLALVSVHGTAKPATTLHLFRGHAKLVAKTPVEGSACDLDYSPSGRHIAVVTTRGTTVYSQDRLARVGAFESDWVAARFVDDSLLLGCGSTGRLELRTILGGQACPPLSVGAAASSMEVNARGRVVASLPDRVVVVEVAR